MRIDHGHLQRLVVDCIPISHQRLPIARPAATFVRQPEKQHDAIDLADRPRHVLLEHGRQVAHLLRALALGGLPLDLDHVERQRPDRGDQRHTEHDDGMTRELQQPARHHADVCVGTSFHIRTTSTDAARNGRAAIKPLAALGTLAHHAGSVGRRSKAHGIGRGISDRGPPGHRDAPSKAAIGYRRKRRRTRKSYRWHFVTISSVSGPHPCPAAPARSLRPARPNPTRADPRRSGRPGWPSTRPPAPRTRSARPPAHFRWQRTCYRGPRET